MTRLNTHLNQVKDWGLILVHVHDTWRPEADLNLGSFNLGSGSASKSTTKALKRPQKTTPWMGERDRVLTVQMWWSAILGFLRAPYSALSDSNYVNSVPLILTVVSRGLRSIFSWRLWWRSDISVPLNSSLTKEEEGGRKEGRGRKKNKEMAEEKKEKKKKIKAASSVGRDLAHPPGRIFWVGPKPEPELPPCDLIPVIPVTPCHWYHWFCPVTSVKCIRQRAASLLLVLV